MSTPARRRRLSFSLRRMLIAFALLSAVFAGGRWYYVRIVRQEQIAEELRRLGATFWYSDQSYSHEFTFRAKQIDTWWERVRRESGRSIVSVQCEPAAFEREDDALRANRLLRELPDLRQLEMLGGGTSESSEYAAWDRDAAALIQGLSLKEVRVCGGLSGQRVAARLAQMPGLEKVKFLWVSPNAEVVRRIFENPSIREFEAFCEPDLYPILASQSRLTQITLNDPAPDQIQQLAALSNCRLDVIDGWLTDDDLCVFARLPNLKQLSCWQYGYVTDAGVAALRDHPSLESVDFRYLSLTDDSLETLKSLPRLKKLGMVCCDVTEAGIISLARGNARLELVLSDELNLEKLRRECPGVRFEEVVPDVAMLQIKEHRVKAAAE